MGKSTRAFAELIDLYPTLVELAGLPPASEENLDGSSLATLFDNPDGVIKTVTLSQYPRCVKGNNDACAGVQRENFDYMGYSMRTDDYRYTEWNGTELKPEWDKRVGVELYSHVGDAENDFDEHRSREDEKQDTIIRSVLEGASVSASVKQMHSPDLGATVYQKYGGFCLANPPPKPVCSAIPRILRRHCLITDVSTGRGQT